MDGRGEALFLLIFSGDGTSMPHHRSLATRTRLTTSAPRIAVDFSSALYHHVEHGDGRTEHCSIQRFERRIKARGVFACKLNYPKHLHGNRPIQPNGSHTLNDLLHAAKLCGLCIPATDRPHKHPHQYSVLPWIMGPISSIRKQLLFSGCLSSRL